MRSHVLSVGSIALVGCASGSIALKQAEQGPTVDLESPGEEESTLDLESPGEEQSTLDLESPGGAALEPLAVLSGLVGSHDRVLAHELETQASRSPSLRSSYPSGPIPAVDADVARFLPDCVAVEKSFDPRVQTFRFDADWSGCPGQSGSVQGEQVVSVDEDDLRFTEVHRLTFDNDRTSRLTLSGEAERTRTVDLETLHARDQTTQLQADVRVTLEEVDGGVSSWPMRFEHTVTLTPLATGLRVTATGTVQYESGLYQVELDGFWDRDACGAGGWTEGVFRLEQEGELRELELDCARSTGTVAGYAPATVEALVRSPLDCEGCRVAEVDLRHTLYVGLRLDDTRFEDVDLTGAVLFGSSLIDARFARVDLTRTDFTEVNLDEADLLDCTFDRTRFISTDFDDAALPEADLRTAILDRISFEDASLRGGNLAGQDLSGVNIEESSLAAVDFTGATIRNRDCEDTNFTGANFTDANLRGSILNEASLSGAIWSNTTCPDGSNSDDHTSRSCDGYW